MKKINKEKYLIIPLIIIIVVSAYFFVTIEVVDEFNNSIFEVESPNDDGRTFTVNYNELVGQNENGAWAVLQLSSSYSFGIRFTNISIPKNAIINDAYLELYSIGTPGHSHPNCRIYCDDVDNSLNFTTYGVLNVTGRNYTSNYALWNSTQPNSQWVKTPSINNCINEILLRPNWTVNNSISVLFVTEGIGGYAAAFQNYENGYPARLYIEWKEAI